MIHLLQVLLLLFVLTACGGEVVPTPTVSSPRILSFDASADEVPLYDLIEFRISLDAEYNNPYDTREISLNAIFTGPDNSEWQIPGFWDAERSWVVRFTPSAIGTWIYKFTAQDRNGLSNNSWHQFSVMPSGNHGWLQVGNWVDPSYNPRYFAYHDGSPFYGIGHCNAFDLLSFGFDPDTGFKLFDQMVSADENILVYWPIYSNPFFAQTYDKYSLPDLKVIDTIIADAERKGIHLIFTIWNHDLLRDGNHPWSRNNMGQWNNLNGFNKLVSIEDFFSDEGAWAWQENLYRYIIARWGYSRSIGMWQTVSEIEGTNVNNARDRWHERLNRYFVENDPYRHPTTASMAGDRWWTEGYQVMDVLQMHSYNSKDDSVETGPLIAEWTQKMSWIDPKPNFIGEFGTPDPRNQPEHLHNGLWSALASGGALTPMDWNDGDTWGSMTAAMYQQMENFSKFTNGLDLVLFESTVLDVKISSSEIQAWGLISGDRVILWVQDISQLDKDISDVRESITIQSGGLVEFDGLPEGNYEVKPYNTWEGVYLKSFTVQSKTGLLSISLPDFYRDLALIIVQKY